MNENGEQPTPDPDATVRPTDAPPTGMPYGTPAPPPNYAQYPAPQYQPPAYPAYPQPAYQQPVYPGQPYPQPGYYAPMPGQYGFAQDHPQSGLALGLGLGALLGGFASCGLGLLLGPFAWYFGQRARKQIKQSNGRYQGEGNATTGMVLGIISTVLLVLGFVFLVFIIIAAGNDSSSSSGVNALSSMVS